MSSASGSGCGGVEEDFEEELVLLLDVVVEIAREEKMICEAGVKQLGGGLNSSECDVAESNAGTRC